MSKDLSKEVREGLRDAAQPVRAEAQSRFSPISPGSAAGYRVVVRQRGVAVEQSRRRTTGKRPDFGRLQLARALFPALDSKQEEVIEGVDKVLGKLANANGF